LDAANRPGNSDGKPNPAPRAGILWKIEIRKGDGSVMTALCPRRVLSAALAVFSLGISIPVPASGNARNSTVGVRVV